MFLSSPCSERIPFVEFNRLLLLLVARVVSRTFLDCVSLLSKFSYLMAEVMISPLLRPVFTALLPPSFEDLLLLCLRFDPIELSSCSYFFGVGLSLSYSASSALLSPLFSFLASSRTIGSSYCLMIAI